MLDEKTLKSLVKGKTKDEILGEGGVLKSLIKSLVEAAMNSEMDYHLGYDKHAPAGHNTGNSRNGYSSKIIAGDFGEAELEIPRDRNSTFAPQIVQKGQRRFDGFDEKIVAMYARGMSTRDIQDAVKDMYGVDISPTLISQATDAVLEDVKAWQTRPLDARYPIIYFDAIVVKIRQENRVINKAIHLALGVNLEGKKELLGMWATKNEGAKFWLSVLTELKNRGLNDIFIACVDGLTGFPAAIESVFPRTKIQLCIVHMVRNSLKFVGWKKKKDVASDLREIYQSATAAQAEHALDKFEEKWREQYPTIATMWRRHWENLNTFFEYPPEIRRVIYTTNAIESLNMTIRKVIKNKRSFPSDESLFKLLYLALQNIEKKWTMPVRNWGLAMNRFMIEFSDRMPQN